MTKSLKFNKKGFMKIMGLVFWVILVGVAAVLTPVVNTFANSAAADLNNDMASLAAHGVVPVMWLIIIVLFIVFISQPSLSYEDI